jgi:hypothetical protein
VDYALKVNRKVVLHVEAKPLNDPLEDVKAITQVVGYAANDGVEWCVLTNGIRYKIYRVSEKAAAPDKILFEVSIDPKDSDGVPVEQLAKTLSRISRDSMAKGLLDQLGTEIFTTAKVRKALDRLFADAPPILTRLIRKTITDPSVTPSQIQQSLRRIWGDGDQTPRPETPPAIRPKTGRKESKRAKQDYPETHHTEGKPTEVIELYHALDRLCQDMAPGKVTRQFNAYYIGWYVDNKIFCSVSLQQNRMKVWVKTDPKALDASTPFARDVSKIGHWGNGDVELGINDLTRLHDAESFIRTSFEKVTRR